MTFGELKSKVKDIILRACEKVSLSQVMNSCEEFFRKDVALIGLDKTRDVSGLGKMTEWRYRPHLVAEGIAYNLFFNFDITEVTLILLKLEEKVSKDKPNIVHKGKNIAEGGIVANYVDLKGSQFTFGGLKKDE